MRNYKALKSASKVSVQKVKVVDRAKVDEVKDDDGKVTTHAQSEISHEELQSVTKSYNHQTGEAQDDTVRTYSLLDVNREIDRYKSQISKLEAEQADLEELEKDLKAL